MHVIQSATKKLVLAALLSFATCGPLLAQGWSWPEKGENLKVLADTTSPETLSRIMRGFTAALGVRCEHCHVGEAGRPLSEFDFPADDKRTKRVAREMLEMVRTINRDVIQNIEEPSGATVDCFTCHRGQKIPPEALHRLLIDSLESSGAESTMNYYDALRTEYYGKGVYDFGPRTITRVADRLLDDDKPDDAIIFLNRGIEDYPEDAMIRFYMGRAYLALADSVLARLHFERALVLDPSSRFIRRSLQSLLPSH